MQAKTATDSRHDVSRAGQSSFQWQAFALPLGPCRASLMRHLMLIFNGRAISLGLSIGNFGFAPRNGEEFGWVPSHEAFPVDAARRM
jgi:hypothetical protein